MIDVRLLYVEEFKAKTRPDYMLHPKEGGIYRAVKRKDNEEIGEVYQIFFDNDNPEDNKLNMGMFLPGLEVNNPIFKCKLREVTIEDILDLDVDDTVFKKLEQWGPDFSDGIEDMVNAPIMNDEIPVQDLADAKSVDELANKIREAIDKAKSALLNGGTLIKIREQDKNMAKSFDYLIDYIADTYDDKYDASLIGTPAKQLVYNKAYGKGVNIFNATKYLQRYMSEGYAKGDNPNDILKAIHYLLYELTRLMLHGKINA